MSKLAKAVKGLAGVLAEACPSQAAASLSAGSDEGQVVLKLGGAVLTLVFFEPGDYPRSGVLLQVDEGSGRCSATQADKLGGLSERFQDEAQLSAIISRVRA
jgi:hypothetical protein